MAERKGSAFRRRLRSAERFSERAIRRGSSCEKTPRSRSSALLVSVTRFDQRFRVFTKKRESLCPVGHALPRERRRDAVAVAREPRREHPALVESRARKS